MTTKEKILTLLQNINYYYNDCTMYETIKKLLEEMVEEILEGQRWIPCSERMPEKGIEVLVSTVGKNLFLATWYWKDDWITDDGYLFDSDVLAWQPVPEPYKGENR